MTPSRLTWRGPMMAKNPWFSTYRQGENRVTSSMLAVFERIDLSLLEAILAAGRILIADGVVHQPATQQRTLGPRRPHLRELRLLVRGQDRSQLGRPRQAESAVATMRGLKQDRNAKVIIAGHAFVQNVGGDTTSWPLRSRRTGG